MSVYKTWEKFNKDGSRSIDNSIQMTKKAQK